MKNLFLSFVLVMVGLVANSQESKYFFPNYESQFVLDSLDIPYVPIPQRNGTEPIYSDGPFERSVKKHNKYFSKYEFDFSPTKNTPSIDWGVFSESLVFLGDETFTNSMLSELNFKVIGFSKINLYGGKYKSIQIVETLNDNQYNTIVLLETQSGFVFFVDTLTYSILQ
jgi:hypothetical protein